MDENLLRKILKAPVNTTKEVLYLETGCLPVKFIIMKRRFLYYHHIIKRPNSELIYKIYRAQKIKPCKGDWINLINKDENLLNITLNEENDKKLSKYKFKKNINKVIRETAFKHLMNKKESRSKIKPLIY